MLFPDTCTRGDSWSFTSVVPTVSFLKGESLWGSLGVFWKMETGFPGGSLSTRFRSCGSKSLSGGTSGGASDPALGLDLERVGSGPRAASQQLGDLGPALGLSFHITNKGERSPSSQTGKGSVSRKASWW